MAGWPDFAAQTSESGPWGQPQPGAVPDVPASPPAPAMVPAVRKASPRLKLSTVAHCKREIAKIYREARRGEIKADVASKLVHILQVQSRLIVDAELEARVEELEQGKG